ncbi:hypothetical protein EV421DRAFT_107304, partial [Armillaria borealis]
RFSLSASFELRRVLKLKASGKYAAALLAFTNSGIVLRSTSMAFMAMFPQIHEIIHLHSSRKVVWRSRIMEYTTPSFRSYSQTHSRYTPRDRGEQHQGAESEGLILMTDIKGVTLGQWLLARTTFPPEFLHYSELIFGPAYLRGGHSLKELSELMTSFNKPVLDFSDGAQLIADLKKALTELRSIPPPSGEVSGLHGSSSIHIRCGDSCVVQPLKNIRVFHDMLLENVSCVSRMPRLLQLASPVYAKLHKLCFSYCDLNPTNILVTEDGRLAAIIDWEAAGWFPEY